VATAENGKKGVQLLKEFSPDLIICDIMMPELDGYGVLHILSKDPATASIPFIFLTAKAEKSEVRKGMELGADDYLTKPFEETELLNAIETRLKKVGLLKREFSKDFEGLGRFLDEAKGMKDLQALSRERAVSHYKKKDAVFHEGDMPHHLFFVAKGKVKTFKVHDDGKEYLTGLYGKGDFFGYVPLLEDSEYRENGSAMEDAEIYKLPKDDFLALLFKDRDVATQFIKMLSNNVAEREKQLLSLAYDTVRKRVADALLSIERRFHESGKKAPRITLSRDDLAAMAGTATETVIRVLSEFKDDEYIDIEGRDIIVLNREGLEEVQ
jgi:CRP-like cAMP-binding protein